MRVEAEQTERARQERLMVERQRQAREDWKRKKEQLMAQRKFEEEMRQERERIEAQIEEERRKEYAEKIAHLEEEERERLLEERRLEEERIKREIREEKERREAERMRMLEERRQMEEELAAARDRQLARRNFLQTLLQDFQNLLLDQRITRAFTFSYFDLLPWFKDRWRDLQEDRPLSKRTSVGYRARRIRKRDGKCCLTTVKVGQVVVENTDRNLKKRRECLAL
jgi:flagellar biosynthesis GTPase FlhF